MSLCDLKQLLRPKPLHRVEGAADKIGNMTIGTDKASMVPADLQ